MLKLRLRNTSKGTRTTMVTASSACAKNFLRRAVPKLWNAWPNMGNRGHGTQKLERTLRESCSLSPGIHRSLSRHSPSTRTQDWTLCRQVPSKATRANSSLRLDQKGGGITGKVLQSRVLHRPQRPMDRFLLIVSQAVGLALLASCFSGVLT